ncbi:short-chain dehydrogenase reductase SDR protein [Naviculisporaceae sp. PSN 640]
MASSPAVVLISGANRGIGRGLLAIYLSRPNHIVIAANRNPSDSTSTSLNDLPKGQGSKLIIVRVDSAVESDASEAVKTLVSTYGINHIDTVIANAGIAAVFPKVSEVKIEDLQRHMTVNVFGVVSLYQAVLSLLKKSERATWVTIGSSAGGIENLQPVPNAAYAPSKIAVHWLTKRINTEEDDIAAFVIHPGWVQTEMGNYSARVFGLEQAAITLEESVTGIAKVIDASTKESHGGKMWGHDGELMTW